jgi:hypothetical protein
VEPKGQPRVPIELSSEIMKSEFQTGFTVVLLVLLTAAAVVFAGLKSPTTESFGTKGTGTWWPTG